MTTAHFAPDAWKHVFNTPLECGLRCAVLLLAVLPSRCDLQRLVQYDYLLVHSGDVRGGPPSLHPATPHRAGELLVRRSLVERGLLLMLSRSVVCRELSSAGVMYFAGEYAVPFLDLLSSPYTQTLRANARWIAGTFGQRADADIDGFMREIRTRCPRFCSICPGWSAKKFDATSRVRSRPFPSGTSRGSPLLMKSGSSPRLAFVRSYHLKDAGRQHVLQLGDPQQGIDKPSGHRDES